MGLLGSVVRVGCWSGGAIRRLEEWSPIPLLRVDRTRLTDPLTLLSGRGWPKAGPFPIRKDKMAKPNRSNDWGFPRWRSYGASREAEPVRGCDRHGCDAPGDRPAPKSPNSPERWWFCESHAAEYNRNWNYFEGLSAEDAAARESDEQRDASAIQCT